MFDFMANLFILIVKSGLLQKGRNMPEKARIPDKLPVINLTASNMVFPYVISEVFLRSPTGKKILADAMDGKCPFIFAVMSKPNIKDIPNRFYNTGMVAGLEIVPEDSSVSADLYVPDRLAAGPSRRAVPSSRQ